MNQFVIVGKVHSIDENKLLLLVTLSNEGILPLCISQSMLENCKVLKVGDTIGVKGSFIKASKFCKLQADKLTFLSSRSEDLHEVED